MASPTFQDHVNGIVEPGWLLFYAVRSYILVLFETILNHNRPFSEVKDEAFARFWNFISPPPDPNAELIGSATLIPPLLTHTKGLVLEVGPGSGLQLRFLTPPTISQTSRIYGAEPCVPLHDTLLANARRYGVGDKYDILVSGAGRAELTTALATKGLLPQATPTKTPSEKPEPEGVFDTIICIRVLCSVANLAETATTLFHLLKPGGKLLVCEHEVNPWSISSTARGMGMGSVFARAMQLVYQAVGWSFFVGNCHLNRDIARALIDAAEKTGTKGGGGEGGWREVNLRHDFSWSVLPYVSGVLIKR